MLKQILEKMKDSGGEYKPKKITYSKFAATMKRGNFEGIVLLGAGGNPDEWIKGINDMLSKEDIVKTGDPKDTWMGAYVMETSGGRTDLALVFSNKKGQINMGAMAMWRLKFGDTSWISDYMDNYASQHNS